MVLSFSYGSHQLLGPTMPRMSRRSVGAMELKRKMASDTSTPVEKKEKWPHAYQRISKNKEYHALEDYFWFYEEWNLINKRFVKRFGKKMQDLLMELQCMYRVKLENKVVMDNVKRTENDWESSLRGSWVTVPKPVTRVEWKDIVKQSFYKTTSDWKLVERIGYADAVPRPLKFFEHSDAHLKTRQKDWKRWEEYCASMAEWLKNEEPHYPEFPYLKVFGDRVRLRIPKDRPFVCKEEPKVYQPSPIVPEEQRLAVYYDGPVGYLSHTWLHFACKPGAVTGHMVKLENVGSTALFYRWERRPLESMGVTTPRRTLGVHVTNCRNFTVMNGAGSVLPGQAREFIFRFSSDVEGYFMESWVLRVVPRMRRPFKPLYLKGVATLKEIDRKVFNKLTQALNHRELMRGIGESLESIQERALKLARPTEEFRNAEFMFSSEAFSFIKHNLSVEPPIYFIPSVYSKFDVLARVVREILRQQPPSGTELEEEGSEPDHVTSEPGGDSDSVIWDGSVMPILQSIAVIQDEVIREQLQQEFQELLGLAQIPPHQTALLHFQMYHTLHNLADAVEEILERVTEDDSIRPTAERLVQSFYGNYLREVAEKEQQDLLEAERVKEFGSEKEKSDSVEFWETELKREVEVASPVENQEMLTYCLKWIQIMTELRCAMPEGFNYYQGDVEQEQAAVEDRMARRIAATCADDETKCWNIFSLERQKTELSREQYLLPRMTC